MRIFIIANSQQKKRYKHMKESQSSDSLFSYKHLVIFSIYIFYMVLLINIFLIKVIVLDRSVQSTMKTLDTRFDLKDTYFSKIVSAHSFVLVSPSTLLILSSIVGCVYRNHFTRSGGFTSFNPAFVSS